MTWRKKGFMMHCLQPATVLFAFVTVIGAGVKADEPARLQMATFRCDVTLPLGDLLYDQPLATVEHPLLAKGVVLDDGRCRYVLCAVDWCTMRNSTHRLFQTKVAEAAGAKAANVAVQCVHQHTAPSFDGRADELLQKQENPPKHRNLRSLTEITDRLAAAVKDSVDRLQPFDHVGFGQAKVERVASIRRLFDEQGRLHTRWSACRDPDLRAMAEGKIDPFVKTVTLACGDKRLVRMHYYATHPQSYYRDGRASYDFPGIARERLETEEDVFQIYFTGCCGDVTAGKYNDGTPKARAELAERLFAGMKASVAASRLVPIDRLRWHVAPVSFVARTDGKYNPEKNRATLADPEANAQARISAASLIACYDRLKQPIELSLVRIGPVRILHLPGEPMVEYQHFAQRSLPAEFVAVAGYGIGTPGYVCTQQAFDEGGYEPSASAIVPESETVVKKAISDLLTVD